ncbi:hypothetical protein SCAR479_14075 [Seiridium cardinale]|uniref:Uncharacterized protein n=1 Tax=Seiridium cardinale TaxID=138064 RepID=A0ABR2X645_9PEZI
MTNSVSSRMISFRGS